MKSSKTIAISAISAAFCGILVGVGGFLGDFDFSCYMLAGIALTLPLYRDSVWGCVLAYLAGSLIGLLFTGFNVIRIVPFLIWFGIHPVLGCVLSRKGVKRWVIYLIELALLEVLVFILLKFTTMLVVKADFLNENSWLFYLIAAPLLLVYDKMVQTIVIYLFRLLGRIVK